MTTSYSTGAQGRTTDRDWRQGHAQLAKRQDAHARLATGLSPACKVARPEHHRTFPAIAVEKPEPSLDAKAVLERAIERASLAGRIVMLDEVAMYEFLSHRGVAR